MAMHKTRPQAESYGQAIGILLIEGQVPLIPGDVGNASSYDYPVIFRTVPGLTRADCLRGAPEKAPAVVETARALEAQGVRAIAGGDGAMLLYQGVVREAVRIPACLSSLLQLPAVAQGLDPKRPIVVVAGDAGDVTPDLLVRGGIVPRNPLVICGLQDSPGFRAAVMCGDNELDSDRLEAEAVAVARQAKADHLDAGAIVIESARLTPYAKAVQQAVDLPVYDFITMIDLVYAATHCRRYEGFY